MAARSPAFATGSHAPLKAVESTTFQVGDDYKGKDALDAHIHAAAVACRADILLTASTADFIWNENESPYEVLKPDEFLLLIDDAAPELLAEVTMSMCRYWFRRSGAANLPKKLKDAGCPRFAERIRGHLLANAPTDCSPEIGGPLRPWAKYPRPG